MFLGYYKNEEASAADMQGRLDAYPATPAISTPTGQLVVIDRIKDLAETARGERFSPQYIENKLKFSPYIAEAVVLGAGRDALAAMICIRFSIISKWAEKKRISFTTYTDLASRPEVYALLRKEVETVNATLPPAQRISPLPAALQGTRRRRRRTDPHPQGPPQRHQREIRRHHRRDLRRRPRHPGRHRDPLPGRHHPAHPHHADGGRPRPRRTRMRRRRNDAGIISSQRVMRRALSRPSTPCTRCQDVDARDKPGHDVES